LLPFSGDHDLDAPAGGVRPYIGDCVIWNAMRKHAISYIDYALRRLCDLVLSDSPLNRF